jgi:hypothetical protein
MIAKVNDITKDPLKAAHDEEERLLMEELAEKDDNSIDLDIDDDREKERKKKKKAADGQPLETVVL